MCFPWALLSYANNTRTLSCGGFERLAKTPQHGWITDPEWRMFLEAGKLNDDQECYLKEGSESKTISFFFKKSFLHSIRRSPHCCCYLMQGWWALTTAAGEERAQCNTVHPAYNPLCEGCHHFKGLMRGHHSLHLSANPSLPALVTISCPFPLVLAVVELAQQGRAV